MTDSSPDPHIWSLSDPNATRTTHLSDVEIGSGMLSPESGKHLLDCALCQQRVDGAADGTDDEDLFATLARMPAPVTTGEWHEHAPSSAVLSIAISSDRAGEVRPGELWTAHWRTTSALVVVVAVNAWQITAAPASTDVHLADEYTLIIDAAHSPLQQPLGIWLRQPATVPLFVLDRRLATLPTIADRTSAQALSELVSAARIGAAPDDDLPVGQPLAANDFERLALLDALTLEMSNLEAAVHVLDELDIDDGTDPGAVRVDVRSHLSEVGLDIRELSQRSGLSLVELIAIQRTGDTTLAQAAALSQMLGVPIAALHSIRATPVELVVAVSRPQWRIQRCAWTLENYAGTFEEDPVPLIHAAQQPIAARTVPHGHGTVPASNARSAQQRRWDERVALTLATGM